MSADRAPARRPDEDGRRAAFITAASRVIAREGIAAATTRRIAEEAGMPPGLLHYWFVGKDELLEAVIADTLAEVEAAIVAGRATAPADGDLRGSLAQQLRSVFQAAAADDRGRQLAMYEMTTWALRKPGLADVARHQYQAYRRLAAEGLSAVGLADDPALSQLVAAAVDGLTLAWLADPEGTDVTPALELLALFVSDHARRGTADGTADMDGRDA